MPHSTAETEEGKARRWEESRLTSCSEKILVALSDTFGRQTVEGTFGSGSGSFFDSLQRITKTGSLDSLQKSHLVLDLATALQTAKKQANSSGEPIVQTAAALEDLCRAAAALGARETSKEDQRPSFSQALDRAELLLSALQYIPKCEEGVDEEVENESKKSELWSVSSIGRVGIAVAALVAGTVAWGLFSQDGKVDEYEPYDYEYDDSDWSED